jgi:hypothetical protein
MVKTAAVAGTAQAVRGRVSRRQAEKFADRDQAIAYNRAEGYAQGAYQQAPAPVQQAPAPAPQAPAAAPPADAPDAASQIKQLAELHDQGILTDEEFTAKKKQLLGI